MKAVLPIYLLTFFNEDYGTTVVHAFTMFCYFFPLLGDALLFSPFLFLFLSSDRLPPTHLVS